MFKGLSRMLSAFEMSEHDFLNMALQMEMLFCSTAVGLPFLIPPMFLTGEIFVAWSNCLNVSIYL